MNNTGLFIFRRDLRIDDNLGLIECLKTCDIVYPIFIFSPEQITNNLYKSPRAVKFMIRLLKTIPNINYFFGDNIEVLTKITSEITITHVFFNLDCTPYAWQRDTNIIEFCKSKKIFCLFVEDYYLFPYGKILNKSGKIYTKFTPFYNTAIKFSVNKPKCTPKQLINKLTKITKIINGKIQLNDTNDVSLIQRRKCFITAHENISASIKFGEYSIRQVFYHESMTTDRRRQLYWREFYAHVLFYNPNTLYTEFNPKFNKFKWWNDNSNYITKWKSGNTGFPIVDAYMRQLNETGNIDNRGRLIVGNFLVKILIINWRIGERYFAIKLIDYDPCINNYNWQWIFGSGPSAQSYYKFFNPWIQSKKYDPLCEFIKKYIPEISDVEINHVHNWNLYHSRYQSNYPTPIVNYEDQRNLMLKYYRQLYNGNI